MLLSTFIAGLAGNPGQQVKFQMPPTVDQALQIAITVFEAEAQEKRNAVFFSTSETRIKGRGNFGQPWKSPGRAEFGQAARVTTDTQHAGRKPSQRYSRSAVASRKGKLLCFKCGKPGYFSGEYFSNKFTPRRNEGRNSDTKMQNTRKSGSTYAAAAR
jgi:hypothetical protein